MLLLKPASSEHKPRKTFLFLKVLSVKVICWFMQEKQMKEIDRIQPFYK